MHFWFLIFFFNCCLVAAAQNTSGITHVKDTSFSNASEFLKIKKKYPNVALAEEIHSDSIKEQKNIFYHDSLMLDVFSPSFKSKTKRTAVLIVHGGGWRSGNRTQHYPLAQQLALKGYVCFTPAYSLSTDALFPTAVTDLKAAVQWVRSHAKKYNIDVNKISILGFSAGGELAAFLGATNNINQFDPAEKSKASAAVNAVIDIDGTLSFVHPESGEGDDSKKTSAATYWFGFSKNENLALWEQASPLTYAEKTTVPFLFINSSLDRMHAGRDDFRKILEQNHVYSAVKTFADAPHSFCLFHPWFVPTVNYIDEFLKTVFNK